MKQYWQILGHEVFLPTCRTWRQWSDRRKLLDVPLFPSYVFVRLDSAIRGNALNAPGFLHFVRNLNGPVRVDEGELEAIRQVLKSGLQIDPMPGIFPGTELEIRIGALAGCRGTLVKKDHRCIALRITAINASVLVRIPDPSWLTPVNGGVRPRTRA